MNDVNQTSSSCNQMLSQVSVHTEFSKGPPKVIGYYSMEETADKVADFIREVFTDEIPGLQVFCRNYGRDLIGPLNLDPNLGHLDLVKDEKLDATGCRFLLGLKFPELYDYGNQEVEIETTDWREYV
ncbi:MAG: hypothetical protein KGJ02_04025 [Verrucomicrobiota bacterium]|nr:hypothetical protein [Verrucomicrobiota bacterium]